MKVKCKQCGKAFPIDREACAESRRQLVEMGMIEDDGFLTIFCPRCFCSNRVSFRPGRSPDPFSGGKL